MNFKERWPHGFFARAQWIRQDPTPAVKHQDAHLKDMRHHRDIGPIHPLMANFDWAEITFMEDCGRDNDDVINCGPSELPEGSLDRRN